MRIFYALFGHSNNHTQAEVGQAKRLIWKTNTHLKIVVYKAKPANWYIYQSKDGRDRKVFPALDWLAQLTTHIPNRREQMVRYYGYYSNKSRGQRITADQDDDIAHIIDAGLSDKAFRKSWARLIQKIYEVDPLLCPKCQGTMKIISFIEETPVIKEMQHLGLWDIRNNSPPQVPRINMVREPTYQPVPDHAPAGVEVWSQVPNYGYWAE